MSVLIDIVNLLSGPTGGMAYHLILLFCIWAIVGLALSRLSHNEHGRYAQRILLAGSLLSLVRFLLIVVGLLDRLDGVSLVRLGPPLERFVDAVSALLICSAFVLPRQKKTFNRVAVGIVAFFTIGLYVIAAFQWTSILSTLPSALYNRAAQRWIWELWQLTFLIPAFAYVLFGPVEEREALSASLGVLVVAHLAQTVYPAAGQIPHAAGWVRLGNLIAFPLLGVSTYLLIFQRFESEANELQRVNEQSLAQITNLMALLQANTQISRSLDLNDVLRNTVLVIAQELQSDLCAIALLPTPPGAPVAPEGGELELAVVFDIPDVFYENTRFALRDYPIVEHAVTQNRPTILGSQGPAGYDVSTSLDQGAAIFKLLSSEQHGPLIVQPIPANTQAASSQSTNAQDTAAMIGAILVCRTGPDRTFTSDEVHKGESLATYLGTAIANARRYSQLKARIEELVTGRHTLETEHVRTKTDLENRLRESKEQASAFMQRMYEAERGEQQALQDTHQVHREMARLRQETEREIAQARNEVRRGIEHAARLTQRIAELDSERIRLNNLVETLQIESEIRQLRLAVATNDPLSVSPDSPPTLQRGTEPSAQDTNTHSAEIAALLDELGRPTASLLRDTDLLANGPMSRLDGQQRSLLIRVRTNAERVNLLLENLTTLREIDAGTFVVSPVPTDVTHPIQQALDRVRFRLATRHLCTRLAIGAVPDVLLDPEYVEHILNNLLDTLCALAQEGTTIDVQAFVEQDADRSSTEPADLHITLTGSTGLEQDEALCSTSPVDRDIVQALVQAIGGRAWCEDHQPKGSVAFHLLLPCYITDDPTGSSTRTGERRG